MVSQLVANGCHGSKCLPMVANDVANAVVSTQDR
jgi:hypothetical protein